MSRRTSNETEAVRLGDGRVLSYRQVGPSDGTPVLYCHGTPSASVEWRLFGPEERIASHGIRLIAPDRAGSGGSTFQPNRRVLDWPADALALMRHLEIGRFAVLGYSGGGLYALACGLLLEEHLSGLVVVSGTAPFDADGVTNDIAAQSLRFMEMSRKRPSTSRAVISMMGLVSRFAPGRLAAQARTSLPAPDAEMIGQPMWGRLFADIVYEATHGSARGARHDTSLMIEPWGFSVEQVAVPIRLWHGTEDRNAPPAMARYLAERSTDAELTWLDGDGHLSAPVNHSDRILEDLANRARGDTTGG